MMNTRKILAAAAAVAIAASSVATFSLSASAEDEYGQAYFIGSFGTEGNWDAGDSDGVSVTSITGDGQYTVEWELSSATETGSSWFLCVVIEPTGDVENMTTDTFPNLEVTLDEVTVDGESYDVSETFINTAYYESSTGVTRIYLHDDWTGVDCNVLDDMTITDNITATFTISGIADSEEETEEEEETDTEAAENALGEAYFIGSFGTESNWDAGDNSDVDVTYITEEGTYTVTWDLSEGTETGSSWFLCIVITPANDVENMTTDTFPDLVVTLDSLTVDGEEYDVTDATVNTAYYEGNPGVTRIYIHDDWSGSGATELLDDMTITDNITATFTISGLTIESTDEDTEGNLGDVNSDGSIDITDATMALQQYVAEASNLDDALTAEEIELADIDGDDTITILDATYILQYYVAEASNSPLTWDEILG